MTVEGLKGPNGELSPIQKAFIEEAAVQCGFCTPGLIMSAVEIVGTGKRYNRDELPKLISGHLCRCTGMKTFSTPWSVLWRETYKGGGKMKRKVCRCSKGGSPEEAAADTWGIQDFRIRNRRTIVKRRAPRNGSGAFLFSPLYFNTGGC